MKDPTAFRERFSAYKNGEMPYENGLPKYANGKRGHIGGSTKQARETVWNTDQVLKNAVDSIANEYLLKDGLLLHRLNEEGFTDKTIRLYNNARNQSLYTGENLLNNKTDFSGVGDFGLDDAGTMILNNQMLLKGEKWWDEEGENEQGRITHGAVGDTVKDTIGLLASALKYFSDLVKKDYPNLSDYDNARYTQAYYQRGVGGGRKWAKAGAKGYNFSTKPLAMRPAETPYLMLTTIQSTAAPKFGKYANGKLPLFKDGDIPYITSDGILYNINPNVVGAEQLNIRVPEVVVTGTDRRPMYQRYDAEHSVYDPEAIRTFTDWAPVVGDVGQGLDAYNAFKNKDYLQAGILGGMLLLPNVLERPGKALLKAGLKYAPNIAKNVYDISKLYTKIGDNPRLRMYANDVADLLNSNQISERVANSIDDVDIAKQISNISNTPIAFSHANKMWIRPMITLEPLGLNYKFRSPIPIQMRAAGFYDPAGKKTFIKRNGRTPEQIKLTTYHETSHASDNASPKDVGIGFYDRKTHIEGKNAYFDSDTEKRARLISILTDAYKRGTDINNKDAIEEFILSQDYTNRNLDSLLKDYNYTFDKADDFYDLLDNGYKDGKLPMFKNGKSPIHINPANRGKFNATKKRTGKTTEELAHSKNPLTRKRAIFALNARKWHH